MHAVGQDFVKKAKIKLDARPAPTRTLSAKLPYKWILLNAAA